jgi:hypothetical protein
VTDPTGISGIPRDPISHKREEAAVAIVIGVRLGGMRAPLASR